MPTREITTNLKNEVALDIQVIASDTTTVGNIISVADFDLGANLTIISGAYADGQYDVLIEDGDEANLSDAAPVIDLFLVGQDPTSSVTPELQAQIGAANQIRKIGYRGPKAFVRLSIVSTSTSSGATLGAIVEKSPEIKPAEITV